MAKLWTEFSRERADLDPVLIALVVLVKLWTEFSRERADLDQLFSNPTGISKISYPEFSRERVDLDQLLLTLVVLAKALDRVFP